MRKIDLLKLVNVTDKQILALTNSGRVMHPEKLTCKDLKRLIGAFETIYELFDKCMVKEE